MSLFYCYVILLWALELWLFEFDWFWCHFQTCSNLFPWQFWVQEAKSKGQNSWSRLFLWFLAKNIIKFDHLELVFSHFGGAKWRNFNQKEKKAIILNISSHRAYELKVKGPKNQYLGKKSLCQEKLTKFLFAYSLFENLDFCFSAPPIKIFNNNQKKFIKGQSWLLMSTTIDQNLIGFG